MATHTALRPLPFLLPVLAGAAAGCAGELDLAYDGSSRVLPRSTPGILLLAQLQDDEVRVHGTVLEGVSYDLDETAASDQPFQYELADADGNVVYRNGVPGPMLVREYLDAYVAPMGFDVLELFPEIGRFPLFIPRIDGVTEVRFSLQGEDGAPVPAGVFTLSDPEGLAVDLSSTLEIPVEVEELWHSGPSEQRLDIAILGDGYTEAEMDLFREQAQRVADELLGREPFARYAGAINVWRVDTPSAEAGASFDCTGFMPCVDDWADNALGSIFPISLINGILGSSYSDRMVFQMDQWHVAKVAAHAPYDSAMVLINSPKYGGFAVYYSSFTNGNERYDEVGTHELGHALGFLGDEYVSDLCVTSPYLDLPPNVSDWADGDPPWSLWIDDGTPLPTSEEEAVDAVGMFEGAYNCPDLYRPAATCKMKTNYEEFCPVCREQLVRRVFDFTDPIQSTAATVTPTLGSWKVSVPTLHEDMTTVWRLDGEVVQETDRYEPLRLPASAVSRGEHLLGVTVTDNTSWVRGYDSGLTDEVWWRFTR